LNFVVALIEEMEVFQQITRIFAIITDISAYIYINCIGETVICFKNFKMSS
jgi:hypothetical protein